MTAGHNTSVPPSPFPDGWYFVAHRNALTNRSPIEKTWLGRDIVAWCDDNGEVCVADAYCPHMGSHLGPTAGGTVRDGCLVCPFHGFAYDATGRCVAAPAAPPPKTARLDVLDTCEINGLVFAWWSRHRRPPFFNLPVGTLGQEGWSRMDLWSTRLATHPEYTTENSVDLAHLTHIHGYFDVRKRGPVTVDGAHLVSRFDFKRERKVLGVRFRFDIAAVAHLYGLGYSFVDITERSIGIRSRLWVFATPIDGTDMELVLVSQTEEQRRPRRAGLGLSILPRRMRAALVNRIVLAGEARDVRQDIDIWARKCYRAQPSLSRADGEIMTFRRFCRQFYADPVAAPDSPESKRSAATETAGRAQIR